MSDQIQESISRYLRGEVSLEDAVASLRALQQSSSGLSIGTADLSADQRSRLDALLKRFHELRKQDVDRLLSDARKAGREVAEIHLRGGGPGKGERKKGS